MKNKGFTLIELLGVIIILALITTLVFPNIINSVKNSTDKTDKLTIDLINNASDMYISNHSEDFSKHNGNKFSIQLTELVNEGLLVSPIKYGNDNDITNTKCVQATYNNGNFTYELKNSGSCETVFDIICTRVDGTSKEVGAKYTCRIMDNIYFYVLENDPESEDISLIMDRNFTDGDGTNGTIPPTVAWCTDGGTDNTICKNINTTGSEAPEGKDYIGHITEVFNTEGITVSFPTAEQIALADGKNYLDEPTLSQLWLYDDSNSSSVSYGYWTATIYEQPNFVYEVFYNGTVSDNTVFIETHGGVRPVITISKSRLD